MEVEAIRDIFQSANIRVEGNHLVIFYPHAEVTSSDEISGSAKDLFLDILHNTDGLTIRFDVSKAWSAIFELHNNFLGRNMSYMRKKQQKFFTTEEAWEATENSVKNISPEKKAESLGIFWKSFNGADFEDEEDIQKRTSQWFSDLKKSKQKPIVREDKAAQWETLKALARGFYARFPKFELDILDAVDEWDDISSLVFGLYEQRGDETIKYSRAQIEDIIEMVSASDWVLIEPTRGSLEIIFGVNLAK